MAPTEQDQGEAGPSATGRPVQIQKWGVNFSGGAPDSLCAFLERVEELRVSRGVSLGDLFRASVELFSGNALVWYRANRHKWGDWGSVVRDLRKAFLPPDYDQRLLGEIRRRTQAKEESMGTYVASMEGLFRRLSTPVAEPEKVEILLRNLAPFYLTQLGTTGIDTVDALVEWGRGLETTRARVASYVPPPNRRSGGLLEPDLAYDGGARPEVHAVDPGPPRRAPPGATGRCWTCGLPGHFSRECRAPQRCFGCNRPGRLRSSCPDCNRRRTDANRGPTPNPSTSGNEGRAP